MISLLTVTAVDQPARSDEIPPRVLDLDFAAAVEGFVADAGGIRVPEPYRCLIECLDADRYADRDLAGRKLLAACAADPAGRGGSSELGLSMPARTAVLAQPTIAPAQPLRNL